MRTNLLGRFGWYNDLAWSLCLRCIRFDQMVSQCGGSVAMIIITIIITIFWWVVERAAGVEN